MIDGVLLWLALLAAVVSLAPLFMVAWGAAGGDGEPANPVVGILGLGVAVAGLASVGAAARALAVSPTSRTVWVMAAPLVLAVLALVAAGPRSWRADPRSRLTADDVRAMGLDPDEHGFADTPRWRGIVLTLASVVAPVAPPVLVLLAMRVS